MADVAKLAGVSSQTVSRALNEDRYVAAETRERVLAAVKMLGYRRNSAARALATGRSHTIGVAVFDTTFFGPASTLAAVERAADDAGYAVTIASLRSLDQNAVGLAIDRLQQQLVDGILVIAPLTSAVNTLPYLVTNVPLVAVETGPEHGVPVVSIDQRAGAELATRHLLELGHRTVRHIAGPPQFLEAEQRVAGWRAALEEAGAAVPALLRGDWSSRSGYDAARELFGGLGGGGAIFVANDQMALGVLRAAHEAGLRVPRDLSLVGFDNIPEAAYFNPPLTTVHQDFSEVGRRSLAQLLSRIANGRSELEHELVDPELVVRETTAPPDRGE